MIEHRSPNHEARKTAISVVVVHASGGSLASNLSWISSPASQVSYHVLVAPDGAVYRLVPDSRAAWGAGPSRMGPFVPDPGKINLNHAALQVAAAHPNDGSPYSAAQVRGVAGMVAAWLAQYPIQAVTSHAAADVRKNDPRAFPWPQFWRYLAEAMK